jgi:hypothetical protein
LEILISTNNAFRASKWNHLEYSWFSRDVMLVSHEQKITH